jgi:hypothetical protein
MLTPLRPLPICLGVLATVFSAFVIFYRISLHFRVPAGLEAETCGTTRPAAELGNARFIRKGGRITPNPGVWKQGSARMVDDVAQGRDLTRYDKLELVNPEAMGVVMEQRDPVRAQARAFLWAHWEAKKRAYLVLTLSSVDATGTSHVFIEPDNIGRWRIYWRGISRREIADSPARYSMAWVIPGEWDKPGVPLAQGQQPDPLRHRLEFRDVCGDFDGRF